jgi:hypothetical protein
MMMYNNNRTTVAATFALLSLMLFGEDAVSAFCPSSQQQRQRQTAVALNLLPGQGIQLIAAYNAAHPDDEDNDEYDEEGNLIVSSGVSPQVAVDKDGGDEPSSSSSHWRALAASRSFAQRIFHLPSSMIKKHPHPTLEGLKDNSQQQSSFPYNFIPQRQPEKEDFVLYPIVGFQFFKDSDGSSFALPTTSHAACHLPTNKKEDVYGWFTPACKLDLYSDDICHAPENNENESRDE